MLVSDASSHGGSGLARLRRLRAARTRTRPRGSWAPAKQSNARPRGGCQCSQDALYQAQLNLVDGPRLAPLAHRFSVDFLTMTAGSSLLSVVDFLKFVNTAGIVWP